MTEPHPALAADLVARLRHSLDDAPESSVSDPQPHERQIAHRRGGNGRRVLKRVTSPLVDPVADMIARRVATRAGGLEDTIRAGIAEAMNEVTTRLAGLEVNAELLKAELRALSQRLEDLGIAIAPAAGLPGVPERFAELRDRVNALDRRVRQLQHAPPAGAAIVPAAEPGVTTPESAAHPHGSGFDYVGFERRFRGDPEEILRTLDERYVPLLSQHPPVLDIGCGRGELLSVLASRGVECRGVDLDAEMVTEARDRGLDVALGDGVEHLRGLPEGSLGSIIAIHVVEHLELDALIELLELAASRLGPGGVLVAETPNPASLVVLGNSYILDPTHVRPLHPSLLAFLCERAGFREVDLRFFSPAEGYHLPTAAVPADATWAEPFNEGIERLNTVLFGPQEYAVVATTPPAGP